MYTYTYKLGVLAALVAIFIMYKTEFSFRPDAKPREFGVGRDSAGYKKTLFTPCTVIVLGVIILHILFPSSSQN
jgi:uncharacterized membrane protein